MELPKKGQDVASDEYDTAALKFMLQGELAAVEAYAEGIGQLHDDNMRGDLERMRDEHQRAVWVLRARLRDLHTPPTPATGRAAGFPETVTDITWLAGDLGLLTALQRGEEYGECVYRLGLGNPDLPDEVRFLLGSRLLPQCQERVGRLQQLASQASSANVT